jgi:hypothetical protein
MYPLTFSITWMSAPDRRLIDGMSSCLSLCVKLSTIFKLKNIRYHVPSICQLPDGIRFEIFDHYCRLVDELGWNHNVNDTRHFVFAENSNTITLSSDRNYVSSPTPQLQHQQRSHGFSTSLSRCHCLFLCLQFQWYPHYSPPRPSFLSTSTTPNPLATSPLWLTASKTCPNWRICPSASTCCSFTLTWRPDWLTEVHSELSLSNLCLTSYVQSRIWNF